MYMRINTQKQYRQQRVPTKPSPPVANSFKYALPPCIGESQASNPNEPSNTSPHNTVVSSSSSNSCSSVVLHMSTRDWHQHQQTHSSWNMYPNVDHQNYHYHSPPSLYEPQSRWHHPNMDHHHYHSEVVEGHGQQDLAVEELTEWSQFAIDNSSRIGLGLKQMDVNEDTSRLSELINTNETFLVPQVPAQAQATGQFHGAAMAMQQQQPYNQMLTNHFGHTGREELSQSRPSQDVNLDDSENRMWSEYMADLDRNGLQNEGNSQDPHRSNTPNHASLASVNYPHDSTTRQGIQTSDEDELSCLLKDLPLQSIQTSDEDELVSCLLKDLPPPDEGATGKNLREDLITMSMS